MRAKLSKENLYRLFTALIEKGVTRKDLAKSLHVSVRTIGDWYRAKTTMPYGAFRLMVKATGLSQSDLIPRVFGDLWHIKKAARKGGIARMKLYGNFGTPEGRRRGGLASIKSHKYRITNFKSLKNIRAPKSNEALAEFMGIVIGDGHLSEYQLLVTTNSKTDSQHAEHVQDMISQLFSTTSRLKYRKNESAVEIVASSKKLVQFLKWKGMPIGNKIKRGLKVPRWIKINTNYQRAFIRGLFDTDGCIYLDKHVIRSKTYYHLGWTITSYAARLRKDLVKILEQLNFSPTNKPTQTSVYLRRQTEIHRYFREIGSSNNKHINRYKIFSGRVPKRS